MEREKKKKRKNEVNIAQNGSVCLVSQLIMHHHRRVPQIIDWPNIAGETVVNNRSPNAKKVLIIVV